MPKYLTDEQEAQLIEQLNMQGAQEGPEGTQSSLEGEAPPADNSATPAADAAAQGAQPDPNAAALSALGMESVEQLMEQYRALADQTNQYKEMLSQLLAFQQALDAKGEIEPDDPMNTVKQAVREEMAPIYEKLQREAKNKLVQEAWGKDAKNLPDLTDMMPEITEFIQKHPELSVADDGLRRAYDGVRSQKYGTIEEAMEERYRLRALAGDSRLLKGEGRAMQRLNLRIDEMATDGLSAAAKLDYYAARAEEAKRVDADGWRYAQYQEIAQALAGEALGEERGEAELEPPEASEAAVEAARPTETSADELADGEIEHYEMSEPELALAEAMEEYAISPETQARMDEQLRAEQGGEAQEERSDAAQADAAPEGVGEAIDENTQLSQTGNDAEAIEYGRKVLRTQDALIADLNGQIWELTASMKAEWKAGAELWDGMKSEKERLFDARGKEQAGTPRYKEITARINAIHTEQQKNDAARASFLRWLDMKGKRDGLISRRNTAKRNMKVNSQIVNGSEFSKQIAEGKVKYDPFKPIPGAKHNRTGVELARALLKSLDGDEILHNGRKAALTTQIIADKLTPMLDREFFEAVRKDAEIITKTRKSTERERADDIFRLAVINEKLHNGSAEGAKDALIDAYRAALTRKDFGKEGYRDYLNARRDAREDALERAQQIEMEYADAKEKDLNKEGMNLNAKIRETDALIANMRSTERAYYQLGDGDVKAALDGEYGGQLPAPLLNIFLGAMADAAQGKKGRKVLTREFDSPKRIVESYAKDYAPLIYTVFIEPAMRGSDVQRAERAKIVNELKKAIPEKEIEVTVPGREGPTQEKMRIREVIGHIIDERREDAYKGMPDGDYVEKRLLDYGITDTETRIVIRDGVDKVRALNDALYQSANEALLKNGHMAQNYDYRMWYMHHYDNSEDGKLLARFGIHTSDDEISQVFTDETGNRRPSHEFNAAALRREGTQTGYDVVESVERSLNGVLNTIHQTGNVDRLKQFEQAINGTPKRDEMGNYVQENNKTVLESRPLYEYAADGTKLDKSYLTGFGNEIGQFSQRAANKRTGDLDRLIEKVGGRKSIGYLRLAASLRSASAVAFNPLSALTNLAPIKFLPIFCSAQETVSALASTIKQMAKDAEPDYIKAHSSFVEARTAHSPEERSVQGKVLDWGYAMSSACDKFATNFMARAMFNHEMNRNGGNGELALKQTEAWLRDVLTDKSRVGRSQFYENMTLGGIFGQFQQESVNELMYMLKDMKHYGGRIPKTLIMMIAVLAMNGLWNHLRGSDTMTDPYGAVRKAVNGFDEDDTLYDKAKGVAGALVETVNPIDFLTSGETAVTNSIKDTIESVDKLLEGEEDIWGFAATLGAMFLPGYSTAKRAYTGVKSVRQGYAETESGKVKFAIEKPNVGKAIFAAIGGVNVLEDARKYNKGESAALTKSDSETYRQLVEMGYTTTDAWNIMRNAKAASSATSEAKRTEKRVDASAGERAEAQTLAAEARESASVPADMPAWAHEEYVSGDDESPVNVGVALWRAYGVDSYPRPIIGASFKRESDGGEVMYKSADGAYYPVTEDDLGAMDREWRQAYRRTVRYYLAGDFGAVGSKEAAEGLASKLSSVRSKISSKYMDGLAANYGGETNG